MDYRQFCELLETLPDEAWQRVADDEALLMIDDEWLETGVSDAYEATITRESLEQSWREIKSQRLEQPAAAPAEFYRTHPLTRAGFDRQTRVLIDRRIIRLEDKTHTCVLDFIKDENLQLECGYESGAYTR